MQVQNGLDVTGKIILNGEELEGIARPIYYYPSGAERATTINAKDLLPQDPAPQKNDLFISMDGQLGRLEGTPNMESTNTHVGVTMLTELMGPQGENGHPIYYYSEDYTETNYYDSNQFSPRTPEPSVGDFFITKNGYLMKINQLSTDSFYASPVKNLTGENGHPIYYSNVDVSYSTKLIAPDAITPSTPAIAVGDLIITVDGNLKRVTDLYISPPTAYGPAVSAETLTSFGGGGGLPSDLTVGSDNKPVYVQNGEVKAITTSAGGDDMIMYMRNGAFNTSTTTVGSNTQPVYLRYGKLTACNDMPTVYVHHISVSQTVSQPYVKAYFTLITRDEHNFSKFTDLMGYLEKKYNMEESDGDFLSCSGFISKGQLLGVRGSSKGIEFAYMTSTTPAFPLEIVSSNDIGDISKWFVTDNVISIDET